MAAEEDSIRHSKAQAAELITDPTEKAEREALNGLRQAAEIENITRLKLDRGQPIRVRVSDILGLHHTALDGIDSYAGNFRPGSVEIGLSKHDPPPRHLVSILVDDLCDYLESKWDELTPVQLAAYTLWRINWIHPFSDGNGRTARAISYLVLGLKLGYVLPGKKTIPEHIVDHRDDYYAALEEADSAKDWKESDLLPPPTKKLEALLESFLAAQLASVIEEASGNST